MTLPNFFIIGAAKSGTSSLCMYLRQHPKIYMSPIKEPHFFSFDNASKMTKGPGDPIYKAITDLDQYKHLFDNVKDEIAIGEASTSYLYRPETPKRIHTMLPKSKFIAILRNPVDRAFSAYMHVVRDKRETAKNFSEALSLENTRLGAGWEPIWHFTNVGRYYNQISRYYHIFDREKIRIFLYEDLIEDQVKLLHDIFKFLEVDTDFIPESSVRFNVSGEQKSDLLHKLNLLLFNSPNPIRWLSRKVVPDIWRGNIVNWARQKNLKKTQISPETRDKLGNIFEGEILKLQDLIERDLTQWLEN